MLRSRTVRQLSAQMLQPRWSLLGGMLALSLALRLLPYVLYQFGMNIDPATTIYPWNFSPLPALCLYGAAFYSRKAWAFVIPFAAYFLGDLGIWALTGHRDWAFYPGQSLTYACIAIGIAMGFVLRSRRSMLAVGSVGFASALFFFVVTNFAVWQFGNGTLYPHTGEGLVACYVAAIPFFRNSLISLALFLPILFSPLGVTSAVSSATLSPSPEGA